MQYRGAAKMAEERRISLSLARASTLRLFSRLSRQPRGYLSRRSNKRVKTRIIENRPVSDTSEAGARKPRKKSPSPADDANRDYRGPILVDLSESASHLDSGAGLTGFYLSLPAPSSRSRLLVSIFPRDGKSKTRPLSRYRQDRNSPK